ncbi:hydroxylase [Parashewanella spongiae]|uniref:Hydroxylase n=1 Tax=Parashewanella spongiae TaxID=342950 RepID=A0A3A6TR12_9GAMM|nr:hydroxylase [Parashewanella spongiae]MCL1080029.1 hydroxylase [Parashewanella spongiae]RJY07455.1 hydroxylase [Parashewanella spongiae]
MKKSIQVNYLEIITPNVDQVCTSYSETLQVSFSEAIAELGGARTAALNSGDTLGIRTPMHDAEEPTTRPYYLVDDIKITVSEAENSGAQVLVPPMKTSHRSQCAIVSFDSIQNGFWQV